jgi:uncharacterized LabA/DUF88 family protein
MGLTADDFLAPKSRKPNKGGNARMNVLVDYNNVRQADRRFGPAFVVDKIMDALGPDRIGSSAKVHVRLYDGWYDERSLTRLAQRVSAEVQAKSPFTKAFPIGTITTKVLVTVELADCLMAIPRQTMLHTFRTDIHADDIVFRHPQTAGCIVPTCPLIAAHQFLQQHRCPSADCRITPEALVHREQQKLVDTMLAVDLLTCHIAAQREVAVVSSDDDLWPAIKLATHFGVQVFHVHTIPNRKTPPIYSRTAGSGYVQLNL